MHELDVIIRDRAQPALYHFSVVRGSVRYDDDVAKAAAAAASRRRLVCISASLTLTEHKILLAVTLNETDATRYRKIAGGINRAAPDDTLIHDVTFAQLTAADQ